MARIHKGHGSSLAAGIWQNTSARSITPPTVTTLSHKMAEILDKVRDVAEGQIDFEGQRLVEFLSTALLAVVGVSTTSTSISLPVTNILSRAFHSALATSSRI